MKKVIIAAIFIFSHLIAQSVFAQDPNFSQFFSSPLNINPALTGNINADWRAISNFRTQWINPASPYTTGTISFDRKILQDKIPNITEEKSTFGVGGMLMYDYAMSGVQKSTYASANMAYSLLLSESRSVQRLGAGFGVIYGRRYIDFSRLDFEEQFTGYGFDVNLPTGEAALTNMKPYFSVSAGLTYSIKNEKSNFDFGVSGFHLNKPRQTFLEDQNQYLPIRKVAHANFETLLSESLILNANAVYQFQGEAKYYSFGTALGYYVGNADQTILNTGIWYWSENAIVPYIGIAHKDLQVGLSYDWTISKLREANPVPKTFELSIIVRGITKPTGIIPCPWK